MTVTELIEALKALDPSAKVVRIDDWEIRPVIGASSRTLAGDHYNKPGEVRLGDGVRLGDNVVQIF